MSIKRLILIILTLPSLSGCLVESMSVVGAGAGLVNAWYEINEEDNYTIISRECLFYQQIKLSEEGKSGLTLDDKQQIASNNLKAIDECEKAKAE